MPVPGVGMVLVTLFETLLREWDPVREFRMWWREHSHSHPHVRAEDIMSDIEARRTGRSATFGASRPMDRRREVLRTMHEAEQRASSSTRTVEAL